MPEVKLDTEIKALLAQSGIEAGPEARRRYGRVAAIVFFALALLSVPSTVLLDPRPEAAYPLILLAIATGGVCLLVPWDRISGEWLHAVTVVATVEVALAVAVIDPAYGFYLVFVIGFIAYVFPRWDTIAAYLGLMTIALVAPALFEPQSARETLRSAVLYLPGLLVVGLTMAYLRDRLQAKEDAYTRFAHDVLGIASHIRQSASRGSVVGLPAAEEGNGNAPAHGVLTVPPGPGPDPLIAAWRSLRARRDFVPVAALATLGAGACVVVLAIAALSLVGPESEPVQRLAIEIPAAGAQPAAAERGGKPSSRRARPGAEQRSVEGSRSPGAALADSLGDPADRRPGEPAGGATPVVGDSAADLADAPAPDRPQASARGGGGSGGQRPEPPREASEQSAGGAVGDVVEDTVGGVGSLLDGRSRVGLPRLEILP